MHRRESLIFFFYTGQDGVPDREGKRLLVPCAPQESSSACGRLVHSSRTEHGTQVLEADLRCIEPLMPETFAACERASPDIHLFVSVRVVQSMGSKQCSTFVKERTCKPVWEEEFTLTVEEEDSELELVVYNFDGSSQHKFVGSVVIRLQEIENGETTDEWYPLSLHPSLRKGRGPEVLIFARAIHACTVCLAWDWSGPSQYLTPHSAQDPLLRVQMTLAAFRWDPLPPRPVDFIPQYRMPTRLAPGRACCSQASICPVS